MFFELIGALNRLRCLLTLWILLVGVSESMLSMRVTTVACVKEQQQINSEINECSYYELYSISTSSSTPPHTLANL